MQSKLVLFIAIALSAPSIGTAQEVVRGLEHRLNAAYLDDERMKLVEGTDLDSPAGTVIFTPREQGATILVHMARHGEPEIGFTFISEVNAWINHSTERTASNLWLNSTYCMAAMRAYPCVVSWHIHNNAPLGLDCSEDCDLLRWAMPSEADMIQLFELTLIDPRACLLGAIGSPLGVTTYSLNSYAIVGLSNTQARRLLEAESAIIEEEASNLQPWDLAQFARTHQGLVTLTFELVP